VESVRGVKRALLAAFVCCLLLPASASASTQTKTISVGPITVGGYQVKVGFLRAPHPPVNGWIRYMDVDVVDGPGPDAKPVPISRLMLHHIVFTNLARRDGTCGSYTAFDSVSKLPAAQRFYAAGEERAKMLLPSGYGYQMGRDDPWAIYYMFMNHKPRTDRAWIRYHVSYETTPQTAVTPYWLDVKNCLTDPVFNVPGGKRRGSTYRRSTTWTVPQAGRLVAGGGHVHGGAKNLELRRKDCGGQHVYTSRPLWGNPDHPFYHVRPILHEPGPISMSGFNTQKGIPVSKGERLRLDANYDDSLVHTRVMGIMVVYLAPDSSVRSHCGALPSDLLDYRSTQPGRTVAPRFRVPIVAIRRGVARDISAPRGRRVRLGRRGRIAVGDLYFRRTNVSVRSGSTLRWDFKGPGLHNVTVANGPRGFASKNLPAGYSFRTKLRTPGTYRLFCALHPVSMTATIKVRRR
jgi:stress up-regulated protein Nod 19/copper binding plastocyanin/azurin family protein